MINELGQAWLLHKKPSGDSSAQLTFFTRERGRIQCLFRGARSFKKQTPIQVFTPVWLAIDSHQDWHYVHKLEPTAPSIKLGGLSLFAALYVNELLYYALTGEEYYDGLFSIYETTLTGLMAVTNRLAIEIILRRFELALLAACGHSLDLAFEAQGGAIDGQSNYQFIAGQGFVLYDKGFSGQLILCWKEGQFNDLNVLKLAKLVMRQAIEHLLDGRPLKSRSLFQVK